LVFYFGAKYKEMLNNVFLNGLMIFLFIGFCLKFHLRFGLAKDFSKLYFY